ncbi:MAG: hypothetical protein FWD65_08135 [Coriobacteriia bacterium]|nr:hypothetical protein [Coriobacteriia bacterium]
MKTTSRKILSLLLSCALLCALVVAAPVTAQAATGVAAIDISSLSDTNVDNSASAATESYWYYTGTSKQLILDTAGGNYTLTGTNSNLNVWVAAADVNVTLDNADITWPGTASNTSAVSGNSSSDGLTITLVGNNTLIGGNGSIGGGLTIGDLDQTWTITSTSGGGLTAKGYNSNDCGIRLSFYDTDVLRIAGNASVTAVGGETRAAIFAGSGYNNLLIGDDAKLAITNNSASAEAHTFGKADTTGTREWQLTDATLTTGALTDDSIVASVATGATGSVKLVTQISTTTVQPIANQVYTGSALKPVPVITDGSKTLVNSTDFTLAYANNTAVGMATITVAGIGAYVGTTTVNFTIVPIALPAVAAIANQVYTGSALKPVPVIKDGSKTLVNGTDFTLAYANNTAVGTATIMVTGIGAYSGTTTINFKIVPAAPVLASLANSTTGPLLKWNKAAGATGYYVLRKTGTGAWVNIKTIAAAATVSYTDTTAVSGTTYAYSVQAYGGTSSLAGSYNTTGKTITYVATPKLTSAVNVTTGVKFTWGKVSGATGYLIYRKTGTGTFVLVKTITSVATVSWIDTTVKSGTTYTYTAYAYKTTTANKSACNATGKKVVYVATPKLVSLVNSKSGPVFKWGKVTGATGYIVYRKTTGGWVKLATIKSGSTISYTDKKAVKGKTYSYTVRAYKTSTTNISAYNTTGKKIKVKK